MKKFLLILTLCFVVCSCADDRTFMDAQNKPFKAKPYGWINPSDKMPGVEYELSIGNVIWSVIFSQTIVAPVILTGYYLYEPVTYYPSIVDTVK